METRITATKASRNFSEILNRVQYAGESFVVERGGKPVCKITPEIKRCTGKDLAEFWRSMPRADPGLWDDVEEAVKNQGEATFPEW